MGDDVNVNDVVRAIERLIERREYLRQQLAEVTELEQRIRRVLDIKPLPDGRSGAELLAVSARETAGVTAAQLAALSKNQKAVLGELTDVPLSPQEIADRTEIKPTSVSGALRMLASAGFAKRVRYGAWVKEDGAR